MSEDPDPTDNEHRSSSDSGNSSGNGASSHSGSMNDLIEEQDYLDPSKESDYELISRLRFSLLTTLTEGENDYSELVDEDLSVKCIELSCSGFRSGGVLSARSPFEGLTNGDTTDGGEDPNSIVVWESQASRKKSSTTVLRGDMKRSASSSH